MSWIASITGRTARIFTTDEMQQGPRPAPWAYPFRDHRTVAQLWADEMQAAFGDVPHDPRGGFSSLTSERADDGAASVSGRVVTPSVCTSSHASENARG